jgi:hypothetical protein
MTAPAREQQGLAELAAAVARLEAGQREVLAELKRRRKAPRVRAAKVARRARERVASMPVTDIDVAQAARYMRRRR